MRLKQIFMPVALSALLAFGVGCSKEETLPLNEKIETIADLNISDDFTWKVKETVEVNITLPEDGYVELTSEDGSTVFAKGMSQLGIFKQRISVPTYIERILVVFNESTNSLSINSTNIDHTFSASGAKNLKSTTVVGIDSDNDGVLDSNDDYPNDATRAFNNYYPSTAPGRLAFEDTWPAQADYDFNDMVIDYQFTLVSNADNDIVEVIGEFEIVNIGAGYTNGFGFQLPWNDYSYYSAVSGGVGNAFEGNQTYPTIILFNTSDGNSEGNQYTVTLTCAANVSAWDIYIAGWNPFLIADGDRDIEIHLPYSEPTDKADVTLFGTNFDDGDPNMWLTKMAMMNTYVTADNLPWAIDVSADFDWTIERTPINQGHLHFLAWANSWGSLYEDWYMPNGSSGTETGYRDLTKIATN